MRLDMGLTENEKMLRNTALDFMQRDAPKEVVQSLQETDTGCTDEIWQTMINLGWPGIIIPEEYGGAGNTLTSAATLLEALGTGPLPGPLFSSSILGSLVLLEAGTVEQKQSVLPEVAKGSVILTLALTEPEYSWEPETVQTTATKQNSSYILNGVKLYTMDAQSASHIIVVARTEKGIGLFLVNSALEGISIKRIPGYLAGRNFEVKLDSVEVPESSLLGDSAEASAELNRAILKATPILCAYKVGACQVLCDSTREYSRTRVQFGQAIGRFQRVQDMIIEMVNNLDAARWSTYEALWKLDTGKPADEGVHMAKAVTSEAYWKICTLTHRVLSGVSYSKEHPASFHTRASRALYHYLGDPAHHRHKLGRLLTGV